MSNKPLSISESAAVQMPMKTVASLIVIVALGTMGYFQIVERINIADTKIKIMEQDVEQNTEFRIKWPRGQMGSLPADSEQYMMLEDLYTIQPIKASNTRPVTETVPQFQLVRLHIRHRGSIIRFLEKR